MTTSLRHNPERAGPAPADCGHNHNLDWRYMLIPLFVTCGLLVVLGLLHGWVWVSKLVGIAGSQFAFAGKFIVFAGLHPRMIDHGFTTFYLALLVIYMDVLVGTIVMINVRLFYGLPRAGAWLDKAHRNSAAILRANPWVRKATFLSLMAFVAFPLTGTGAIGGGFFGRLLGLSKKTTFLGLLCGSVAGSFGMFGLAELFGDLRKHIDNVYAQAGMLVGGIVVILAFVYVLSQRVRKGLARAELQAGQEAGKEDELKHCE